MKNCPNCGGKMTDGSSFCEYCGYGTKDVVQQVNQQPQQQIPVPKNKTHKGAFIAGLVCLIVSIPFWALYFYQFLSVFLSSDKSLGIAVLLIIFFSVGIWITLPGLILSIVSIICFGKCFNSTSKGIKITSIILFVISLLVLVLAVSFFSFSIFSTTK